MQQHKKSLAVLSVMMMFILFIALTMSTTFAQDNNISQRPPNPPPGPRPDRSGQRPPRPDHSGEMPPPPPGPQQSGNPRPMPSGQRPPRPLPSGQRPPRPMPSGQRPPRPDRSGRQPGPGPRPPRPDRSGQRPPRPQDSSASSASPDMEQDDSNIQDGNEMSKTQNRAGEQGLPIGLILGVIGGIVACVSLCLACGAGIAVVILKKKGYSISLQKSEAHQQLREEEDVEAAVPTIVTPQQYIAQNPVAYSINQVHYPNLTQQV